MESERERPAQLLQKCQVIVGKTALFYPPVPLNTVAMAPRSLHTCWGAIPPYSPNITCGGASAERLFYLHNFGRPS